MARARVAIGFLLLFSLAHPAAASASTAVLLPVMAGDEASFEMQAAVRALAREVLEGEGLIVYDAAEVAGELPEGLRRCGPHDRCAFELRAVLAADLAIGLTLTIEEGELRRVGVLATGARGVAHRSEAVVDPEAGPPFAIAEALRSAIAAARIGRPGEPPPAPELAPVAEAPTRIEASPINWFLGGFLVLGSAPMLGYGINTAAREGDCVREGPAGGCTQRVRFREGAAIFTGLGAAMLVAGIAIVVIQPIPVVLNVDGESASLHVQGTF